MEAVKILEMQPRRTPRRKRARNVQTVTAGTGEALPGRNAFCGHDLVGSSSSPAGESPVRVAARTPGSRLAAWSGNGPGRSPASKAPLEEATERSVTRVKPAASLDIEGEPSRAVHSEGHGSGEDPGDAAAKDSSA